jgi:hypothetical protein
MKKTLFLIMAYTLFSSISYGDEPKAAPQKTSFGYVGGLLGPSLSLNGSAVTAVHFGGEVAFSLFGNEGHNLMPGFFVSTLSSSEASGGLTSTSVVTYLGAQALYKNMAGGLFIGVRTGLGFRTAVLSNGVDSLSATGSSLFVAPVLGYDAPIGPLLVGAEASLPVLFPTRISGDLGTAEFETSTILNVLGTIKFRF